jgi:hypothetical protein
LWHCRSWKYSKFHMVMGLPSGREASWTGVYELVIKYKEIWLMNQPHTLHTSR